jgi:predicted dehydrogenase
LPVKRDLQQLMWLNDVGCYPYVGSRGWANGLIFRVLEAQGKELNVRKADAPIKVAVVGCGAVAELGHLPAIWQSPAFQLHALVDLNRARAESLNHDGSAIVTTDYREIIDRVDFAIIATPPASHAEIAIGFLQQKKPVLIEKPMALTSEDAHKIVAAADANSAFVAVSHTRRFFPLLQFARDLLINRQAFGSVHSVVLSTGGSLNTWPFASDYAVRSEQAGGGVLMNFGPHLYDTLLWWFDTVELESYEDDAAGGIEVNCRARLKAAGSVDAEIRMSYTDSLMPECYVETEQAVAAFSPFGNTMHLRLRDGERITINLSESPKVTLPWVMGMQLENIRQFMAGKQEMACRLRHALRVVELLEESYTKRRPLRLPWSN